MENIIVKKRNSREEALDIEKIHKVLYWATEGLNHVSISEIEMNSKLQFQNGMTTEDIHDILIKSTSDLISVSKPNYQYVAARLLLFQLRKKVLGQYEPISLQDFMQKNYDRDLYDPNIIEEYNNAEIQELSDYLEHERDLQFSYAGLRQLIDKYLLSHRDTGEIYETPQYMYMLIAMVLFIRYPKETRLDYVKRYYDAISTFKISLPTPIMSGVRTRLRQYSSCTLIEVGDSLESIFASVTAVGYYSAQRAGIGLNVGAIRSAGAHIRGGEVISTGLIPFLKVFEASVKSTTQNGIRGGSASVYFPWWHMEVLDILPLKNNAGTDDNRVRKLDYSILMDNLIYDRIASNNPITLFSPQEVPQLYENFGLPEFEKLYLEAEKNPAIKQKREISARELFNTLLIQRLETGRIYVTNIDNLNAHSSFIDPIRQSNLCTEVALPTSPIKSTDDKEGEIGICILSAVNVGVVKEDEYEEVTDLIVRSLDELVDYQEYPLEAARISTLRRRSLAIGMVNLAYYLASRKLKYSNIGSLSEVHRLAEKLQYYSLKASNNLAKEKGACEFFHRTKYSKGILPIDTYSKNVNKICDEPLHLDWETLRADIKKHGLRNSALTAIAPTESSSVVSNATNGIEPIRDFLVVKKSKKGNLKQVIPEFSRLSPYYEMAWEMPNNKGFLNIVAVLQKFLDQAISVNTYYQYSRYENNRMPLSEIADDLLYAHHYGIKTLYYANSDDGNVQFEDESCESGACAI